MTSITEQPLPLHLHTLDTLCESLIAGLAVLRDDRVGEFRLDQPESRSILQWYWENRARWDGPTRVPARREDCEAIVDRVDLSPPDFKASRPRASQHQKRILRLRSMKAHRFGGLHRFGSLQHVPEVFEFDFRKPLNLIEGKNGVGKSSLLSAVSWCLTGLAYRSQRPPEAVARATVPVALASEEADSENSYSMSPITPVPSAELLSALRGREIPVDTWVEVVLQDDTGQDVKIRRRLKRSPRGVIQQEEEPDLAAVGLDPISWRIGTVLSNQIPYVQLDRPSDLGSAIATLTGLRSLKELAKHANRVKERLTKELYQEKQREIARSDEDFQKCRETLLASLKGLPNLLVTVKIPASSSDSDAADEIGRAIEQLGRLRVEALTEVKTILGEGFNPADLGVQQELKSSLAGALFVTKNESIKQFDSFRRLSNLRRLPSSEVNKARSLAETLESEAQELAELEQNPEAAARHRLYQRTANWLRDQPVAAQALLACPLCLRPFSGEVDPELREEIAELLRFHLEHDKPFMEKTLRAWAADAVRRIDAEIATSLRESLPAHPWDLVTVAIREEILNREEFRGCLAPLRLQVEEFCRMAVADLPDINEPGSVALPLVFGEAGRALGIKVQTIHRAVAFHSWLQDNKRAFEMAFQKVMGEQETVAEESPLNPTFRSQLAALGRLLTSTAPLEEAETQARRLSVALVKRRDLGNRLELYRRTASAIVPLIQLEDLVEDQLGKLINELSTETESWKHRLYKAALVDAPAFHRGDVAADGRVEFFSKVHGSIVASHHISNSSDLRATLLAFLIAFLRYVLRERGGLALLMLDDPQELFDQFNRRSVANAIPQLVPEIDVLMTTNDRGFGDQVFFSMRATEKLSLLDRLLLHPCHRHRDHVQLTPLSIKVDELKRAFESPDGYEKDELARQYASEVRSYAEECLLDCFEISEIRINEFELDGLLRKISDLARYRREPFSQVSFRDLVKEFPPSAGNRTLTLLNRSHHGRLPRVTFSEVWEEKDKIVRLIHLVDQIQVDLDLWLRRDLVVNVKPNLLPALPKPVVFSPRRLPIAAELAAFSAAQPISAIVDVDEHFNTTWLENKAFYRLTSANFGFSAEIGQIAIVSLLEGREIEDGRLVIALYGERIFARRLLRFGGRRDVVALSSEAENPLERKQSLILPADDVRLLKVVGVVFDFDAPLINPNRNEAIELEVAEPFREVEVLFRVRGRSALPLALDDQLILGGPTISEAELSLLEGSIAAIAAGDHAFLKRIGARVGKTGCRLFESIGLQGDSLLLRTQEEGHESLGVDTISSARRVLGVLYDVTG